MPYQESPYFETPPRNEFLWRYMTVDKFMAMLYEESLYFPNVTLFEDRDEGRLSHITLLEEVCKTNLLNEENTPIKKDDAFRKVQSFIEKAGEFHEAESLNYSYSFQTLLTNFSNHLMFCSSWFLKNNESHSMWAEYGDKRHPTSVAIQTTVRDLIDSLEFEEHNIHIGKVKYKNYRMEHIEGYEDFSTKDLRNPKTILELFYVPVLHKRDIFEDEKEVRAIISFESICDKYLGRPYTSEIPFYSDRLFDKDFRYENAGKTNIMEGIPEGISIKINIKTLIKRIVISPNAKDYFHKSLERLVEDKNINPAIIRRSEI